MKDDYLAAAGPERSDSKNNKITARGLSPARTLNFPDLSMSSALCPSKPMPQKYLSFFVAVTVTFLPVQRFSSIEAGSKT